ncbi:MAG: hypothetical protein AAB554_04920 [Patescibacteria group bacterium]
MQSAMVIMGHEKCFRDPGRALVDFLKRECHMRYVVDVSAGHLDPYDVQFLISLHATRAARQPFLLAYIGHGYHDGWYYGKENKKVWLTLTYDWLEKLLKEREGPTLVLNDTCHAGSLAERVRAWKQPHETCVVAATSPKGCAYGQLTPDVIKSWHTGDTYEPKRRQTVSGRGYLERRVGVAHDKFFLAKPA